MQYRLLSPTWILNDSHFSSSNHLQVYPSLSLASNWRNRNMRWQATGASTNCTVSRTLCLLYVGCRILAPILPTSQAASCPHIWTQHVFFSRKSSVMDNCCWLLSLRRRGTAWTSLLWPGRQQWGQDMCGLSIARPAGVCTNHPVQQRPRNRSRHATANRTWCPLARPHSAVLLSHPDAASFPQMCTKKCQSGPTGTQQHVEASAGLWNSRQTLGQT